MPGADCFAHLCSRAFVFFVTQLAKGRFGVTKLYGVLILELRLVYRATNMYKILHNFFCNTKQ